MQPVKKLAENKAKSATEEMVVARNSYQNHETKLKELIQYRVEYIEQFHTKAKKGMQATQFHQYHRFISQLELAITQQQSVVTEAEVQLEQRQQQWQKKDSHKRAIHKVVNRFKSQEQKDSFNKEQGELDELNTQKHNHRSEL